MRNSSHKRDTGPDSESVGAARGSASYYSGVAFTGPAKCTTIHDSVNCWFAKPAYKNAPEQSLVPWHIPVQRLARVTDEPPKEG